VVQTPGKGERRHLIYELKGGGSQTTFRGGRERKEAFLQAKERDGYDGIMRKFCKIPVQTHLTDIKRICCRREEEIYMGKDEWGRGDAGLKERYVGG